MLMWSQSLMQPQLALFLSWLLWKLSSLAAQ